MKETGIIMSGDHPKLTLGNIKIMTRRTYGLEDINGKPEEWLTAEPIPRDRLLFASFKSIWYFTKKDGGFLVIKCPYGGIGDRLWVRETWRVIANEERYGIVFKDGGIKFFEGQTTYKIEDKWRPSIFMPRWASRITLEITGVRVERLQDICESDVISEGCPDIPLLYEPQNMSRIDVLNAQRLSWFAELWDSLNAKRGYGWDTNPWVWVIEFKVVK